ncbi:uncharacterized mitochondrial protein AtMg00810-like [Rutidosis leptorrhynchoides]|uniref:uncharacterized mitochondrial protein AtMg00810-like n=1 Tax=Rutidosis leptorrhynchoides TaxID=125765 RepID=UPI003A99522A
MTLQDYGAAGWHMDTGATSHLTSCVNNLSTVFTNCKYSTVAVGNRNTIPGTHTAYLLLYVDDIVLTASSTGLLQQIISSLPKEFAMTDLGPLNYLFGIHATRTATGMFLSQRQYATEIIERAEIPSCNPCRTPVEPSAKLTSHGPPGTTDLELQLYASSPSTLIAYSDADWAGCPTTRRSTSGYCVFHENNLLSWSSKRQLTPSRSSAEAEYRGLAMSLHRLAGSGQVRVLHVPSRYQFADIFTKCLSYALFDEFRSSLNIRKTPAPTAGDVRPHLQPLVLGLAHLYSLGLL